MAMLVRRKPWMKRACAGEAELLDDVVLHPRRGGGGERDHRRRPEQRQALAEQPVVGAEVVAPLRDAVRLVDRDEHRLAAWRASRGSRGRASRSGAMKRKSSSPGEVVDADLPRRGAVAAGVDALGGEARSSRSLPTWSSISAMSGLTTSVVPPRASPGSW